MNGREGEVTRTLRRVEQTIGKGRYTRALAELLHLSEKYPDAGKIRPRMAEVLLRRGTWHIRQGRVREARGDFERSLVWKSNPGACVELARTFMIEGRFDRAGELLYAALDLDGAFGPAHETLGLLMMHWGDHHEAVRAFEHALDCGHATPALYRGAWEAYMKLGNSDRAHDLILEGAEKFSRNDALQAAAGDSFVFAKGESALGVPYWRRAARINPSNFGALFSLAAAAAFRGDRQESLDLLRRCAKLDLERARRLWKEDLEDPLPRFREVAADPAFRRALGWEGDA